MLNFGSGKCRGAARRRESLFGLAGGVGGRNLNMAHQRASPGLREPSLELPAVGGRKIWDFVASLTSFEGKTISAQVCV